MTKAAVDSRSVKIRIHQTEIPADVLVPAPCTGVVVFAHGSGSSRLSPRNRAVARTLVDASLATVLADLMTEQEAALDVATGSLRFDIGFLAKRLVAVMDWVSREDDLSGLPLGVFGASTGAAAAIVAAVDRPDHVAAVVSRGGRPDLAWGALALLRAPTLLIVGGVDARVLTMNQNAFERMKCEARIEVVPGASHLFEEPGALERVSVLARDWFLHHFRTGSEP